MVFAKKWSDEQNEKILELHGSIPNEEIAKMFNTTASNISKRVSYLRKLNKKQKKKSKKKVKKENSEKRVEVLKAKSHAEADDFTKEFKKEFTPINEFQEKPQEEMLENEKHLDNEEEKTEITNEIPENKVNWKGSSNIILSVVNTRFIKSGVNELEDWEREQFSESAEACLEQFAPFLNKYSNLISLGIITTEILVTRILEFMSKKRESEKKKSEQSPFKTPTEIPQEKRKLTDEEEIELSKQRYNEEMQFPQ